MGGCRGHSCISSHVRISSLVGFTDRQINELPTEREYLTNNEWLNDLGFLVDITGNLNNLNVQLQGSNKLFCATIVLLSK